jgi:hypothetical protein
MTKLREVPCTYLRDTFTIGRTLYVCARLRDTHPGIVRTKTITAGQQQYNSSE